MQRLSPDNSSSNEEKTNESVEVLPDSQKMRASKLDTASSTLRVSAQLTASREPINQEHVSIEDNDAAYRLQTEIINNITTTMRQDSSGIVWAYDLIILNWCSKKINVRLDLSADTIATLRQMSQRPIRDGNELLYIFENLGYRNYFPFDRFPCFASVGSLCQEIINNLEYNLSAFPDEMLISAEDLASLKYCMIHIPTSTKIGNMGVVQQLSLKSPFNAHDLFKIFDQLGYQEHFPFDRYPEVMPTEFIDTEMDTAETVRSDPTLGEFLEVDDESPSFLKMAR